MAAEGVSRQTYGFTLGGLVNSVGCVCVLELIATLRVWPSHRPRNVDFGPNVSAHTSGRDDWHPRKTPKRADPSLATSFSVDGDDDLKTWNAAVPFISSTGSALLPFLFLAYYPLIRSRYPDCSNPQTSP